MANFNDFWAELKSEIGTFATKSWADYRNGAVSDGQAFADKCKADLMRWTELLATRQLSKDDFDWLVLSKKDLAELVALKQAGLAQVALDRFVSGLLNVIVTSAFKVFL
jgi:hypothetical protein